MVESSVAGAKALGSFTLACPICRGGLHGDGDGVRCARCGERFRAVDGIWRFLSPSGERQFEAFLREYRTVRAAEGWGRPEPAYFQSLPWVPRDDPQRRIWKRRARSYRVFVERVLRPLEARRDRPLRVLDLGAGNCWLAQRIAARGHAVMAIDLATDPTDGLGALRWYVSAASVYPVQADFDHLPLAAGQVDLVVFNGSFHYSADYRTTLGESLRVLGADGQIVLLDSPCYDDAASGAAMIRERDARFSRIYGFSGKALAAEGFLSRGRLDWLGSDAGLQWFFEQPGGRWRELVGRMRGRLAGQRERATFPILIGRRGRATPPRTSQPRIVRAAWRLLLRLHLRFFRRHRAGQLAVETVNGTPIVVLPGVFNPKLLRTGAFLVEMLDAQGIRPDTTVLDLGTGSGIGAVFAGRRARRVVAVDINPDAVRCARINVLLHQLEDRCEVREGDLFGPVAGERFDLILFNPPFYRGEPRDASDRAWRATDVVERFAAQLADHLAPDGEAWVILSSDGDAAAFLDAFQVNGLTVAVVARRDLVNETLVIYRVHQARR